MADFANHPHFKDEQWMTTAHAMVYFCVTRRTLQRWCNTKQIFACYIGGTKYYPKKFNESMMYFKAKDLWNNNLDAMNGIDLPPSQL